MAYQPAIPLVNRIVQANAVDKALIAFTDAHGLDVEELMRINRRIYDLPFESENRMMASGFLMNDGTYQFFAKGDADTVLGICKSYLTMSGTEKAIDVDLRLRMKGLSGAISKRGNSAIALASALGDSDVPPSQYSFLCILELTNPLQESAAAVIEQIRALGIRPMMLTGDRTETAQAVAGDCGIAGSTNACLTGKLISRMPLNDVARQAERCSVFSRLLPSQKGVIVRLLRQKGHHVVMVGDGPNDAIALKTADVGISFSVGSSPLAVRFAKILLTKLSDLPLVLQHASRLRKAEKLFKWLRAAALTAILLAAYLIAFFAAKVP